MMVQNNTLNRLLLSLQQICNVHQMRPSFNYGAFSDFNANNNIFFPAIWVEPVESKVMNSIQGVKAKQFGLNVYALDRIDKGDSNFQEIHSDMMYLLDTIIAYIRESSFTRNLFIEIDYQDQVYTPITRDTDENCNGFRCRLLIRVPDPYTPCNSPFDEIDVCYFGMSDVIDAGNNSVLPLSVICTNVIDAGNDVVLGTPSVTIINVFDAGDDQI